MIYKIISAILFISALALLVVLFQGSRVAELTNQGTSQGMLSTFDSFSYNASRFSTELYSLVCLFIISGISIVVFLIWRAPMSRRTLGIFISMIVLFPFSLLFIALPVLTRNRITFNQLTEMRDVGWAVSVVVMLFVVFIICLVTLF